MFGEYTIGSFMEESLSRWNAFVEEVIHSEHVHILGSYPFQNSLAATVSLGRLGRPDGIAKAVAFVASDDSSYVTGIELFVDGGVAQV